MKTKPKKPLVRTVYGKRTNLPSLWDLIGFAVLAMFAAACRVNLL